MIVVDECHSLVDDEREDRSGEGRPRTMSVVRRLAPLILGLAASRVAVISMSSVGAHQGDAALLLAGIGLAKCIVLLALAVLLFRLPDYPQIQSKLFWIVSILQVLCFAGFAMLLVFSAMHAELVFALNAFGSLAGTVAMFYWLVQGGDLGPGRLIVLIASARLASEIVVAVLPLVPDAVIVAIGVGAVAVQALSFHGFHRLEAVIDGDRLPSGAGGYFSGFEGTFFEQRFIAPCIVGCILVSVAIGLLQEYPRVASFETGSWDDAFAAMVVGLLCLAAVELSYRSKPLTVVAAGWIVMQLLGAFAMLCYTFFSHSLDVGSVLAIAFDSIMGMFKWYMTVALLSLGKKNPYYYAVFLYLLFLLPRNAVQWGLSLTHPQTPPDLACVLAVTAFVLVASGQVLFLEVIRLLSVQKAERRKTRGSAIVNNLLGLDGDATLFQMREAATRKHVEELADRYGLSAREVEVLTLIALGYTQQRAAEELFISKHTLHAHMGHIYDKTGLHSRQEVLDCIGRMDESGMR